MSEPDRLRSSETGYDERPRGATSVGGGAEGAATLALVSQEARAGELCGGDDGDGGAWGSDAEFDATAHGALAAQAGAGPAFMAEMSRRGQADELRAGAAEVSGPVGPGDAHPPLVDMPLIYRSDGKGVTVELLTGEAAPSGWNVVEPSDRAWPLYYALYRARTDPGEADYAALGPVVGELFGPQLMAGLPGAGEWRLPQGVPGDLYVGSEAHKAIGEYYKTQHGGREDIYINHVSVSGIADDLRKYRGPQYQHLRPELGGPFKPDITDAGLKHLYEIKPAWSAAVGQLEAQAYMAALNRTGLAINLGPPGVPGTRGKIAGPGGWFTFDVVQRGVIGYRYVRKEPVPHLLPLPERVPARRQQPSKKRLFEWRYWEEVTGLTGAALLAYLIISQGSRIIPIRNVVPIP